jgi:hypothetical protein
MANAQKPYFVFRRNGRVPLNRRGRQFSRDVRIRGSNAGYTMFRGSVKGTGYVLHWPVSPSLPLPFVAVCHHISTGVNLSLQAGEEHIHFSLCVYVRESFFFCVYPVSTPCYNLCFLRFAVQTTDDNPTCTGSDRHIAGLRFSFRERESALKVIEYRELYTSLFLC